MLEVRLIGKFDTQFNNGEPITLSTRAAQSLFAFLILTAGTKHRREKLAGMFWPDAPEEKARAYLRHELWRIRKALSVRTKTEYLDSDDIAISFTKISKYFLDVDALRILDDQASVQDLMDALSVYQGELLPGFYEDWASEKREHLQSLFEKRMGQLLDILETKGRWREILDWGERWISYSPGTEAAYQYLMRAYKVLGEPSKNASTYERCAKALQDLGLEPSEQTRSLLVKRTHKINIPIPLTSFIGRETELKEVADLLSKSRLVTLTGSGGVGKTRLAIQSVAELLEQFPDGIWFLDLAPLNEAALILNTLASLLGIYEPEDQRLSITDLLINYFRSRTALIIFDNCEHLVEACAQYINLLLTSCDRLSILATSREILRVSGEIPYRVPSLDIPTAKINFTIDEVSNIESVKLFIERASTISPAFAINKQNELAIVQICQRLDGIPLAIELASARVNVLTVEQIARRLDDCFNFLTSGLRDSMPRHQTLRATIEWSYGLLSDAEHVLFRRLAVFSGGWTLEAAEKVCRGNGLETSEILDLLSQLVNKSLVMVKKSEGNSRYYGLETILQFAREKLIESGEYNTLNTSHCDFFLSLAELAEMHLEGGRDQIFWFNVLDTERENLRTALDWCRQTDQFELQARLACALYIFWWRRGYFIEGRRWIEALLSKNEYLPKALVGKLLWMASRFAGRRGESTRARADAEQAVKLCREVGDKLLLAMALRTLAMALIEPDEQERARLLSEETLGIYYQLGDRRMAGGQLGNLASGALDSGDYAYAISLAGESLEIAKEFGDELEIALNLLILADARFGKKELDRAESEYREALQALYYLGDKWSIFNCLEGLAAVAIAHGQYGRAARLLGASEQQATLIGGLRIIPPAIEAARANLAQTEFDASWAEGQAMSLDQAVAYALQAI